MYYLLFMYIAVTNDTLRRALSLVLILLFYMVFTLQTKGHGIFFNDYRTPRKPMILEEIGNGYKNIGNIAGIF